VCLVPMAAMALSGIRPRYHDITISTSGVWRILKRLGLNRLLVSQRYRRHNLRWKWYEKQRPGQAAFCRRDDPPRRSNM
jgi:hypothetical protein